MTFSSKKQFCSICRQIYRLPEIRAKMMHSVTVLPTVQRSCAQLTYNACCLQQPLNQNAYQVFQESPFPHPSAATTRSSAPQQHQHHQHPSTNPLTVLTKPPQEAKLIPQPPQTPPRPPNRDIPPFSTTPHSTTHPGPSRRTGPTHQIILSQPGYTSAQADSRPKHTTYQNLGSEFLHTTVVLRHHHHYFC